MKDQAKPRVTYIRNGKEKIIRNRFSQMLTETTIYDASSFYGDSNIFIESEIEFLHFKNWSFPKDLVLSCKKNTILILEDCYFQGQDLNLVGGYVQLISPKFVDVEWYSNFYINGSKMTDFSIYLDKNQNQNIKIKSEEIENFYLDSSKKEIHDLRVHATNIYLKNLNQSSYLKLTGEKLVLDDSNLCLDCLWDVLNFDVDSMFLIDSTLSSTLYYKLDCSSIDLKNSSIISKNSLNFSNSDLQIVLDKNSKLWVGENCAIKFGQQSRCNSKPGQTLILNGEQLDMNLTRAQFISKLKTIKELLEQQIIEKVEHEEQKLWSRYEEIIQRQRIRVKKNTESYKRYLNTKTVGDYLSDL